MQQKIHSHSHIHNNTFQPDSVIFTNITDETWKEEYDSEALQARHIGNNLYIIVSIPHTVYNIQRYDLVKVEPKTMHISDLIHRGRNTSIRIVFNEDDGVNDILDDLVEMGCTLDSYSKNMMGVDLDIEDSRELLQKKMQNLIVGKRIKDWEYVVQGD